MIKESMCEVFYCQTLVTDASVPFAFLPEPCAVIANTHNPQKPKPHVNNNKTQSKVKWKILYLLCEKPSWIELIFNKKI